MLATARSISFLFFLALALGLATAAQAGPDLPVCGNGVVDEGEQCDDGNNTGGDGCSPTCQSEVCGNGTIDPGEQCDDGDTANDDGCNDQCQIEICGDGDLNPGEACDDGNNTPGDGCRADCTIEACGDGIQDAGEQCDDGNVADGDGCSANCTIEGGGPFCGDGNVDEGEACDDGNNTPGDGCRADCTIEMCGDEILDAGEECDDGNLVDGDGCSANCTIEAGEPFCGDGSVDEGEECDDGNNTDGDGCSATCTIEEGDGQNDGQQACINGLNKAGEVVNETVNKVGLKCLKDGVSEGCSDGEKKIAKAFERTVKTEEKKCEEDNLPDFAYTGAEQVNESASGASATLFRVFVDFAPMARGFTEKPEEPEADRCKVRVAEAGSDALEKLFKLGNKAKKASLAEGASSGLQLQTEVVAFIDQDGKFESNAEYQVLKALSSKCKGEDLREVAPGCVVDSIGFARGIDPKPELSATALAECVVDSARCGWCLGFNGMDDLDIDCDAFDDGVSNGSCGEVVALEE